MGCVFWSLSEANCFLVSNKLLRLIKRRLLKRRLIKRRLRKRRLRKRRLRKRRLRKRQRRMYKQRKKGRRQDETHRGRAAYYCSIEESPKRGLLLDELIETQKVWLTNLFKLTNFNYWIKKLERSNHRVVKSVISGQTFSHETGIRDFLFFFGRPNF